MHAFRGPTLRCATPDRNDSTGGGVGAARVAQIACRTGQQTFFYFVRFSPCFSHFAAVYFNHTLHSAAEREEWTMKEKEQGYAWVIYSTAKTTLGMVASRKGWVNLRGSSFPPLLFMSSEEAHAWACGRMPHTDEWDTMPIPHAEVPAVPF